jgi:hypothetical protein
MSDEPMMRALELRRDDPRVRRLVEQPMPDLDAGAAMLRVDRVGLSANNVTYAVTGETLRYWSFFPTDQGWGRLPVWGFATVERSRSDGVPEGQRYFGYLPLASHVVVEPSEARASGFVDAVAHRIDLPAPYNAYRAVESDGLHRPDAEDAQAVLLPLYLTSFVLEDYLRDRGWFSADQVLVTSASAKTTIGTAMLAAQHGDRPLLVGLTSPRHAPFARGLGCYDEVVTYDDLAAIDRGTTSVLVDVAGSPDTRTAVHDLLDERLTASIAVGLSHWDAGSPGTPQRGPTPHFFFAPAQVTKRVGEWGAAGYQHRLAASWHALVDATLPWLTVESVAGLDGAPAVIDRLLDGAVPPDRGLVVENP